MTKNLIFCCLMLTHNCIIAILGIKIINLAKNPAIEKIVVLANNEKKATGIVVIFKAIKAIAQIR